MRTTTNYGLFKPEATDNVDISKISANMDTIDTALADKMDADVVQIKATQTGAMSKTYTISSTGYKTILQMESASRYWTANGGRAYCKFLISCSTVANGTAPTTSTKLSTWLIEATYAGDSHSYSVTSINQGAGNYDGILRYFGGHVPKSASYAPQIAVASYSAATVYVTVTILSCTDGWVFPATLGGDPGTSNYNAWRVEMGRYSFNWDSITRSGSIGGRAATTWDTFANDRCAFGESAIVGSMMALSKNGYWYKLADTTKEFVLPLQYGRATGTFTYNGSVSPPTLTDYAQIYWSMRGIPLVDLTNTTMQNPASNTGTARAFTVPTLSAGQWGKVLYLTGTLSNGCFKPDGNIVFEMQNGKTNVPIGRIDRENVALNTVPTNFSIIGNNRNAYTLDSNGNVTHIDGIKIYDANTTYTSKSAVSGGTDVSLVTTGEKYTWNNKQDKNLVFTNKSASSWVADSTYSDYGYRCAVALSGVTANDVAEVIFSLEQSSSGVYAPVCETYNGGVYIYASENTAITIPTIIVFKG